MPKKANGGFCFFERANSSERKQAGGTSVVVNHEE
jgi:hypothetical protein